MTASPAAMRELARRLLPAKPTASSSEDQPTVLVDERLRLSVTRFAGADGFASLLQRSLALSSPSIPALRGAKVRANGRVEGLEQLSLGEGGLWEEAAIRVTAQLLELLITFIGEPLTRRLVREACPEISADE